MDQLNHLVPSVASPRLDQPATDALEKLAERLLAIETAAIALERLGVPWSGLDAAPTAREPFLRLAILAAVRAG